MSFGFVASFGVKLLGYTWVGQRIKSGVFRLKPSDRPNIWLFGLVRTALGIAFGAGFFVAFSRNNANGWPLYYYAWLVPIRIAEWVIVFALFFRKLERRGQVPRALLIGFSASVFLDLLGIAYAFLVPGAISV